MEVNSTLKTPYLLVELLESFTNKELNGLKKIVSCAYFNTDSYVVKLLDVLKKKVLNKAAINQVIQIRLYNLVFSKYPPAKDKLNKKQKAILHAKISLLTRLAEKFITIEALEQFDKHKYDLKMNALLSKRQYRLFHKHLKKAEKLAKAASQKNKGYEFHYLVEQSRFRELWETGNWIKTDNINQLIRLADLDYLNKRMNWTVNALQLQTRKPKNDYNLSAVKLKESELYSEYFKNTYPYLVLQMASIELSFYKTEAYFNKYLQIIKKNESSISKQELVGYYAMAKNFCIRMEKKGNNKYLYHYVDIQKRADQKELLLVGDKMPINKFKNIIFNGCKIEEFDWVHYIIEKYTPYIEEKYRIDIQKFNLGYVAFQKGNYEKAINYFLEVNNFQKNYDIDKRMLILKSYYELEKHYSEPTAQLFRSIEAFVVNNKQYTDIDKKMYKNAMRIFYNLYRYKHKVGKMTLDKLEKQVEQAEYITSKTWLLEKIEELRK